VIDVPSTDEEGTLFTVFVSRGGGPRPTDVQAASAIVLAGGRSSRMGRDKAMMPIGGSPLIVRLVTMLAPRFADIVVVAAPSQPLPALAARVIRDEVEYQGPLAGLARGLREIREDVAFAASCDSVALNPALVDFLLEQIPGYDAVLPIWRGRPQPLHAVYRRSALAPLEDLVARGQLRLMDLFERIHTNRVVDDEIRRFDPEGSSLTSVNTPGEYAEALRRLERS